MESPFHAYTFRLPYALLLVSFSCLLSAAPSSIDAPGMPKAPSVRYDLETVETVDPEAETWYLSYSYFEEEGKPVRHGLYIERTRSRDRERHATHYEELRRIYYSGEPSMHEVTSIWIDGILRRRDYRLSEKMVITLEYNEQGEIIRGLKQKARGGRAKRERITELFDRIYELNTP
jgi:hypothetical protein